MKNLSKKIIVGVLLMVSVLFITINLNKKENEMISVNLPHKTILVNANDVTNGYEENEIVDTMLYSANINTKILKEDNEVKWNAIGNYTLENGVATINYNQSETYGYGELENVKFAFKSLDDGRFICKSIEDGDEAERVFKDIDHLLKRMSIVSNEYNI